MKNYTLGPSTQPPVELSSRERLFKNKGTFKVTEKGHLFALESVNNSVVPEHLKGVLRGEVCSFTRPSRNRLIREISSYGKLCPIFITLTYGADYPDTKESKKHLDRWWKRVAREFPDYWAVWKLEFQKRGAPHYHMLVYSTQNKPRIPKEWVSDSWADVVGDESVRKTGTRVESLRSHRGGIWYATKYLAKVENPSENKDSGSPESDKGDETESSSSGRFWGVLSRKNRPKSQVEHRLSPSEYKVLLHDLVRRYAQDLIKRDRRKDGCSWDEINTEVIDEDEIAGKMKEVIAKSKIPVHLMSDESSFVERIQRLAQDPYFCERAEKFFAMD